jgi:hypothetical protein
MVDAMISRVRMRDPARPESVSLRGQFASRVGDLMASTI